MSQVLSPSDVAAIVGVDAATVRRWVRAGAAPNVFASLPGRKVGIPLWWVEQLISPAGSPMSAGEGGAGPSYPTGTPQLRTVSGGASPLSA